METFRVEICRGKGRNAEILIEFAHGHALSQTNAPYCNFRTIVILAANWSASHAPQHGDLTDVREGISNWPLEKFPALHRQRLIRGEAGVKIFEGGKKARNAFLPRMHRRVMPFLFSFCDRISPFQ